jgi:menaquinol-cytochrome c reductase iron-sulfur subunit
MSRRKLLTLLLGAGGTVLSGVFVLPAVVAALSPAARRGPSSAWRAAGPLEEFPIGEVVPAIVEVEHGDTAYSLDRKAVYVWRTSGEEVVVYSRSCTDLSCPVHFDRGSECFFCPCHGGIFAKDGTPMAGPPPRPLYRYATRIENGVLEIDLFSLPPMT